MKEQDGADPPAIKSEQAMQLLSGTEVIDEFILKQPAVRVALKPGL